MKKAYAEVIVDIAHEKLDRPFLYRVPDALAGQAVPGSVVRVPFGRGSRIIDGYIVGFTDRCSLKEEQIKSILEVRSGSETAEARLIALAAWMSHTYGSTMIQALKTVIPVRKSVRAVTERTVAAADPDAVPGQIEYLRKKRRTAGVRVMETLAREGSMSQRELLEKANVPVSCVRKLEEEGYLTVAVSEMLRMAMKEAEAAPPAVLSAEQERAVSAIRREWEGADRPVLLQGVTGSGKTVVYTELIDGILKEGKQAIVLIPEIALTRQTVLTFVRRFGDQVSFLHSRLSMGERYDQMRAAMSGRIRVMVGPRSALFTPYGNLGLIIIDEEHEESYHSETMPRYHAREVAVRRAEIEGAHVVLGSATPSMASAMRAREGVYAKADLPGRFGRKELPQTKIIDMREELKNGNRSILSDFLREEIGERLRRKEQVMLFLNRRGYSGAVTCRSCGHVMRCPHCDVSLTRHRDGRLICHYCGYEQPDVRECPSCGSPHISGITIGTQQVEEIVGRTFPGARVARMDLDTTRGKEGHSRILADFAKKNIDILVGTQMIVKGHDFPSVTLVGVLLADLSLNESDYRSSERTFQLVTQAAGRAGRGDVPGLCVIQSYRPDHFAIVTAARQDYESFFAEEELFRRIMRYPPCGSMCAVLGSSKDEEKLSIAMRYIRKYLQRIDPGNSLSAIGPAPQAVGKVRDVYREVIYIRSEERERLIRAKDLIEEYTAINTGFDDIYIQFDFQS